VLEVAFLDTSPKRRRTMEGNDIAKELFLDSSWGDKHVT
jgi:hypothetical protein